MEITYPCYFLYGDEGGLQCNVVDGNTCLCLFTSVATLQRYRQSMQLQKHGLEHVDLQVAVDEVPDYDGLIDRLKSGVDDLEKSGIYHISIDANPGQPVGYTTIREFIEQLPRS